MEAIDPDARKSAVTRLTDQGALSKIATDDKDLGVRSAASSRLADMDLLAKAAVEGKDASTRIAAIFKLSDQLLLAKVATEDKDESVREAADVCLTALKTANLPYSQRVVANCPKLRKGMEMKNMLRS